MSKELRVILERMVEINDETFERITPLFIQKKLQRKQHLFEKSLSLSPKAVHAFMLSIKAKKKMFGLVFR
jgi:uncharacterized Fe-S cluster-containing radical SAM superfamily protein